jgi:uncharacterized protein (TIGR00251 family)
MQCILTIKVVPRSGTNKVAIDTSGTVKIYLKSSPEKGLANNELIYFLSKTLSIPQLSITIVSGAASRTKRVKIITDLTAEQLLNKLGIKG